MFAVLICKLKFEVFDPKNLTLSLNFFCTSQTKFGLAILIQLVTSSDYEKAFFFNEGYINQIGNYRFEIHYVSIVSDYVF